MLLEASDYENIRKIVEATENRLEQKLAGMMPRIEYESRQKDMSTRIQDMRVEHDSQSREVRSAINGLRSEFESLKDSMGGVRTEYWKYLGTASFGIVVGALTMLIVLFVMHLL